MKRVKEKAKKLGKGPAKQAAKEPETIETMSWSDDLRCELKGRNGKPMTRTTFERWMKKAEATTGSKRVYRGVGPDRRMYAPEVIVERLKVYYSMKVKKG